MSYDGVCKACKNGDHSYHNESLGGICIGCACERESHDSGASS